jgi:hypothetical protein
MMEEGFMVSADEKIEAAIRKLKSEGHSVEKQMRGDKGEFWFEIDRRMLTSGQEMQNLADGIYSLAELEELFRRRKAEEASDHPDEVAEKVVNEWATYFEVGHADTLPPKFKDLVNRACEYQNAKRNADNNRNTFRLVKQRTNDPDPGLDALLEQADTQEREAREVFVNAYKDYCVGK